MAHEHRFRANTHWTGAVHGPTTSYGAYSREFLVQIEGKPDLVGSAAPPFLGDGSLHNPEDLLLAAVSTCHMLSYLAIAARAGVSVVAYEDECTATMAYKEGKMRFVEATLRPRVTVSIGVDLDKIADFHHRANQECFIANSLNFPVTHEPQLQVSTI